MQVRIAKWFLLSVLVLILGIAAPRASAQTVWSEGAYYPDGDSGLPTVAQIIWSGLTHVIMVGGAPQSGGSISYSSDFSNGNATALVAAAHAHGVKATLGLSQVNGPSDFNDAMTGTCGSGALQTFITNIMSTVNSYGFDGVFIDYEETYTSQFPVFMACLRTAVVAPKVIEWFAGPTYQYGQFGSGNTAACGPGSSWNVSTATVLGIANNSDRVSLSAYDLNNFYTTSYFNSPLYSSNYALYGNSVSADWVVASSEACGIAASKLMVGIPFFGSVYTGGNTAPYQAVAGGAIHTDVYYNTMAATYNLNSYTYDPTAHVPWSAVSGGYAQWENAQSITDKINYVYATSLGGWMIWTMGNDETSGVQPLMNAAAAAFRQPSIAPPIHLNPVILGSLITDNPGKQN